MSGAHSHSHIHRHVHIHALATAIKSRANVPFECASLSYKCTHISSTFWHVDIKRAAVVIAFFMRTCLRECVCVCVCLR